jgi:hypothetical protein
MFLLGFVIVMPLLALPAVARRLDDWLYGPPPENLSQSRLRQELAPALAAQSSEGVSPASFDEVAAPAFARGDGQPGLDDLPASPPPLDPLPTFERLTTTVEPGAIRAAAHSPLDDATAARLVRIRAELETLGAEYILLETSDAGGTYRFHCQIRVSDAAPYTREFEATAGDPLAAALRVLGEVSAWRTAGRPQKLR